MNILNRTIDLGPYESFFQKLGNETLRIVINDRSMALKYAKKGVKMMEPDKLNDKYVQIVAENMQRVAVIILGERTKNS